MIGIIAGAFDVIHPGYILAFMEAKQHCHELVVCLHTDPSIERPEKMQPILSVSERMMILQSIRYVDRVIPYATEKDFLAILKEVNPGIRFLGQDYSINIDKITCAELNIPIHYLDRSHGWSATQFKALIRNQNFPANPGRGNWILTEDEWKITNVTAPCWRCGSFMPLSDDHICLPCFEKEKACES